ncbi:DUF4259 domain-containing protein [Gordonia sp. TBRC 11910]|uniref:DUF4259 domain-containing protein n=1 Tax=Gordonia asplenii TaxID=2725283 RepID=A0A848KVJ6_9ACTN|nr:DUF4259 domain-containing protein [Gordonia asplenii]NMO00483.1 DUF4259 domain-containing protein [Gordonia asplenii]
MGVWDTGPFDNDDAGDWVDEFDEASPDERLILLRSTLQTDGDNLEIDRCLTIIAAAATVAALIPGGPSVDEAYGPQSLNESGVLVTPDLRDNARRSLIVATAAGSEWSELWAEVDGRDEALEALHAVLQALIAK